MLLQESQDATAFTEAASTDATAAAGAEWGVLLSLLLLLLSSLSFSAAFPVVEPAAASSVTLDLAYPAICRPQIEYVDPSDRVAPESPKRKRCAPFVACAAAAIAARANVSASLPRPSAATGAACPAVGSAGNADAVPGVFGAR